MDLKLPAKAILGVIQRRNRIIIPNGSTLILPKDKLFVLSNPADQKKLLDFIQREK